MSVIGDFTIPASAFALDHALSEVPEMSIESDRLASHSAMEVLPFVWATGGDAEVFREALEDDETVTTASVADELEGETLYRLQWSEDFRDLINDLVDHHAVITRAKAQDDEWTLRLRFAQEEMVSEFQMHFRETGHRFEVHSLWHPTEPRQKEFGITADQREALVAAVRAGYFGVPRTTTAAELGETLGISANSTSERIRRGCQRLIESRLMLDDSEA